MDTNKHLAIASVPIQQWNTVYDEEQAFKAGTIFPELNKPFFVTALNETSSLDGKQLDGEQAMLLQIQKTSFVCDDLRLFLDTHPEDKQALALLKDTLKRKTSLMREFALKYYPLAEVCMGVIYKENPDSDCYCWPEGRIPWEGVCS